MNLTKTIFLTAVLLFSSHIIASGGDDAGNGGWAYRQSIKILKMAAESLEYKIQKSQLNELLEFPERRTILQDTLNHEKIRKLYFFDLYRNGKKLAMDYRVNPPRVTVAKAYYVAFSGKTDNELEDASLEVQKRLLHEASHIWGYNEEAAEKFSIAFLNDYEDNGPEHGNRPDKAIEFKNDYCSCLEGKSEMGPRCDSFCANVAYSYSPVLYVNTIVGPDISLDTNLGNLYNWCTVQLKGDRTAPQCALTVKDKYMVLQLPITIMPFSNSFSVDISPLGKGREWTMNLVEFKTGSYVKSLETKIVIPATAP